MSNAAMQAEAFLKQHPGIDSIDLILPDLNGVSRGKRVEASMLAKVLDKGFNLPRSIMGADVSGATVEETDLGYSTGDCDNVCLPVADTLSIVPWYSDNSRAQLLCTMNNPDGSPFVVHPRHALERVVNRFETLGYSVCIALELEFYLVDKQRGPNGELQFPRSQLNNRRMTASQMYAMDDLDDYDAFISDILDYARQQNIPAEAVVAEDAVGQFEVNLMYSSDVLKAADQAVLLKRLIRGVAKKHGFEASFMAKPYIDDSGSGLHVHLSVFDKEGNNIFAAGDPLENTFMQHAAAGLLEMSASTQALICPTINSFRRLSACACAPLSKTWAFDNRTVSLRIPAAGGAATRLEYRVAGADANPYLAAAAMMIGVAEGLSNKLTPPAAVIGNAYDQEHPMLADNQRDALKAMESDGRIVDWLGEEFVRVYSIVKWHDLEMFERQITQLEYELLFPYV